MFQSYDHFFVFLSRFIIHFRNSSSFKYLVIQLITHYRDSLFRLRVWHARDTFATSSKKILDKVFLCHDVQTFWGWRGRGVYWFIHERAWGEHLPGTCDLYGIQLMKNTLIKRDVLLPFIENTKNEEIPLRSMFWRSMKRWSPMGDNSVALRFFFTRRK